MTPALGYDKAVQRSIPATVALFGLFAFVFLFVSGSKAQNSNASAAPGSGGHSFAGASVGTTSAGHSSITPPTGGITPPTGGVSPPTGSLTQVPTHNGNGQHPQHHSPYSNPGRNLAYPYPYLYGVAVPYAADDNPPDPNPEDDSDYQGGPTIFDRRGSGASSYIPPDQEATAAPSAASDSTELESPQDPTTLIFKDGHQIEVDNYAIVGQTLYDLTPGHPRKVALADLDLQATAKENDDHGVAFQLPSGAQAN
jgi:hypothetical protein